MSDMRMAACGINCAECASYKVTIEQDLDAAELLVEWYRGSGWIGESEGASAVMKKAPLCKGCWDSTDDCFFKCGCNKIDFRICCNDKQINHCGECSDFPCEFYKEWASWGDTHQRAMEHLLSLKTIPPNEHNLI